MLLRRALAASAILFTATHARAAETTTNACLTASEEAQALRDEGKLLDARARLIACGRGECPAIVRTDCARWLEELSPRIPAFVVRARDASGADLVDVRTIVDGVPRASSSDGRAIEVDPGVHKVRFERPGSAIEQTVVARERERDRIVDVVFDARPSAAAPRPVETPATSAPDRPIPVLSFVLAGVAVAGGASFAYFASAAKNDVDDMRATCAPSCPESDVSRARTELTVANVSLVVGVLALGGAVALYLTRPTRAPSTGAATFSVLRF